MTDERLRERLREAWEKERARRAALIAQRRNAPDERLARVIARLLWWVLLGVGLVVAVYFGLIGFDWMKENPLPALTLAVLYLAWCVKRHGARATR